MTVSGSSEDSVGGGATTLADSLDELKRTGCRILVSGDVTHRVAAQLSRVLFGSLDATRYRILGQTDLNEACVRAHFPADVSPADEDAKVVDYGVGGIRSAVVGQADPTPRPIERDPLEEFRRSLVDAISVHRAGRTPSPAELRVGVVSLRPLLDAHGLDAVVQFTRLIGGEAVNSSGWAFFYLGLPSDSSEAAALREVVDIHIRVRQRVRTGPEQNWDMLDHNIQTGWIPIPE